MVSFTCQTLRVYSYKIDSVVDLYHSDGMSEAAYTTALVESGSTTHHGEGMFNYLIATYKGAIPWQWLVGMGPYIMQTEGVVAPPAETPCWAGGERSSTLVPVEPNGWLFRKTQNQCRCGGVMTGKHVVEECPLLFQCLRIP